MYYFTNLWPLSVDVFQTFIYLSFYLYQRFFPFTIMLNLLGFMISRFLLTLYLILGPNAPKVHPHHHTLSWGFMLPRFILTIILYPGALCSQGSSTPSYFILALYALKVHPHHHTWSWGSMLSRFILTIILYPGALCSQGFYTQIYLILGLYALKVPSHTILNPGA